MIHYKKILVLPLLGFLAASCTSTSNLQTSEVDDVYFSSQDKVTAVAPTYTAEAESSSSTTSEESGQVYMDDASGDITSRVSDPGSYSDDERSSDDDGYQYSYYDAPFANPYYAYGSPYYSGGFYPSYSSMAMMSPFYSPYGFDPYLGSGLGMGYGFGMGYGMRPFYSGLSLSLGYGFGGIYSPYGMGYGYGFGSPYYGGYGYGLYDNYYAGARSYRYAPRRDRSTSVARSISSDESNTRSNRSRAGLSSPGYRTSRSSRSSTAGIDNTGRAYPSDVNSSSRSRRVRTSDPSSTGIPMPSTETRSRRSSVNNGVQRSSTDYTPSRSYEPSSSRSSSSSFPSSSGSRSSSGGGGSSSGGGGGRRGRN